MGYVESTNYYRNSLIACIAKHDSMNAKQFAILYVKVLREMAEHCDDYMKRVFLKNEADKYENIAAVIVKEGASERVLKLITESKQIATSAETDKNYLDSHFCESADNGTNSVVNGSVNEEWVADIFQKCLPATLVVKTENGIGTGFFVSKDGLFVTNHHVIHERNSLDSDINITSGDAKVCCKADFIISNKKRDIALLKADIGSKEVPTLSFIEDYATLRQGADVMVIGNAFSFGLAPIVGNVKFTHASSSNDLIFTAPSNNGDSGGPVLNRFGQCVGINKSVTVSVTRGGIVNKAQGLTNATPADEIVKFISDYLNKSMNKGD